MRRAIGTFLLLAVGIPGCVAPTRVIDELPAPIMDTQAARPVVKPPAPPVAPPTRAGRRIGPVTIVVDAGHGGKDPGALGIGSAMPEKAINLEVARHLTDLLQSAGARVIATRTDDRFIDLDQRAAMAERTRADLFVSVHADSSPRRSTSGATVYVARGASSQSRKAARHIAAALKRAGIDCRGVRQAGFRVLVGHSRPAVLIECGYLTNSTEVVRLNTPTYRAGLASAIADGIADHFPP